MSLRYFLHALFGFILGLFSLMVYAVHTTTLGVDKVEAVREAAGLLPLIIASFIFGITTPFIDKIVFRKAFKKEPAPSPRDHTIGKIVELFSHYVVPIGVLSFVAFYYFFR